MLHDRPTDGLKIIVNLIDILRIKVSKSHFSLDDSSVIVLLIHPFYGFYDYRSLFIANETWFTTSIFAVNMSVSPVEEVLNCMLVCMIFSPLNHPVSIGGSSS